MGISYSFSLLCLPSMGIAKGNESFEKEIYQRALKIKIYEAEKKIIHVRSAIIIFNTILYWFFMDKSNCIEWLAIFVIIASSAYSLIIELAQPYQKFPILLTGYFTSITDCIAISLWILATGGYHSPFFVLWYISIFAVSFRFQALTTTLTALLYCICYGVVVYIGANITFSEVLTDVVIRWMYIFFAGTIGILITQEHFNQTQQRMRLETLSNKIKEVNEQLKTQTTLYENMLQAQSELGEGVGLIINNKVVYVNDALCNITGYSRNELMDLNTGLKLVAPEERIRIKETEIKRWKGQQVVNYVETKLEKKNGEKIFIGFSSQLFLMRGEKHLFYILKDITNQKLQDQLLEKKTRDLISQNEELEQFAYFASHDLLEPLRMVNSFLTLLEKKYHDQLDDTARQYINFATDGAVRMRKTILDLLEYSRVGSVKDDFVKINMNELMNEVLELCVTNIEETGAKILWENLPEINGRKTYIRLIFQNLIENALKYRKKDVQPVIKIEAKTLDTHYQFSVTDNGIGIATKSFDRIFVLFQRLHAKDEYSGTGVGLAICKKIAEMHKGKIWVNSNLNEGSTFYFTVGK